MGHLSHLRNDYTRHRLQRSQLHEHPVEQFRNWLHDAIAHHVPEPTAMCLSTVDAQGMPQSRIVLLKDVSLEGLTFFTNYSSDKGKQLANNPQAALNFHWSLLERQVRVNGMVMKTPIESSDEYFASRPVASRLGAWASPQSQVVSDGFVDDAFERLAQKYPDGNIARPAHWGGYVLVPRFFEFWQGGTGRLHDRFRYTLQPNGNWAVDRLAP